MELKQKNGHNGTRKHFGSHAPLVDSMPSRAVLDIRVSLDVNRAEAALKAEPDPARPETYYDVNQQKRLALGGLRGSLVDMLLLLESDPLHPDVLRGLSLLEKNGHEENIRVVARILLEKINPAEPAVIVSSPEASSSSLSAQGP